MNQEYFTTVGKFGASALPVTAEQWKEIRESASLKDIYDRIRNCDDEALQRELKKGLTWWTPHCSKFKDDHRAMADALRPQRRVTLDFDENKGRSEEICRKALKLKEEKGWQVILVEESTRNGTHVVLGVPEGMTAEYVAKTFCEELGETYDTSVLSIEHCLFMSPYTLYIDEQLLFRDTFISEEDAKAVWAQENGKVKTGNGKLLTTNSSPLTTSFPTHDENGHNLRELANELIVQHCKNGHTPVEGERHTLLKRFAPQMALKCENNPEWLSQVLPTYGLDENEFLSIVQWACSLPQKAYTPRALKETMQRLASSEGMTMDQPPLPTTLPTSIVTLLEGTPEKCQPAVIQAILTAMMLYLHPDVRFHCTDNIDKIPAGINICSAPHASGKSAVNYPIDVILKSIMKSDAESEEKERQWREKCQTTGSNKDKPKRPTDMVRQIIPTDITSAAFTQLLLDAKGKALYMKMDELDQLLQLTGKANPKYLGPIIRYAYDSAQWGQLRVSAEAVSGTAPMNLKIQTSTTPAKALEFFLSMLSDGTFDRATFSTITGKGKPIYGEFGEDYEKAIQPYINRIAAVRGTVHCPEAMQWADRMEQEQEALAEEMGIKAYSGLLPRAIQSAFFRAVMVYLMEDCKWSEELEQWATWSLENDLWCKWQLFGQKLIEAQEHEDAIMHSAPRMRSRTLNTLPTTFSREDMYRAYAQQGKTEATADSMLRQWKCRKLIKFDEETNQFTKTA